MACAEAGTVVKTEWKICYFPYLYPCAIRYCSGSVRYPCIRWCSGVVGRYPCGIRLCRKSIRYPCGVVRCTVNLPYPCLEKTTVDGWCYDFSAVGETCFVLRALLYGCCNNREYRWTAWCLGAGYSNKGPGVSVSGQYSTIRICFEKKLEEIGPCTEGNSLPEGGQSPGGPVDPGSVTSSDGLLHRSELTTGVLGLGMRHFTERLGICPRCVCICAALTTTSWIAWLGLQNNPIFDLGLFALSCSLSLLLVAHLGRYYYRVFNALAGIRSDCSCTKYKRGLNVRATRITPAADLIMEGLSPRCDSTAESTFVRYP